MKKAKILMVFGLSIVLVASMVACSEKQEDQSRILIPFIANLINEEGQ